MASEPILIVGAGRVRHGDDAVGILAARLAARRLSGLACCLLEQSGWDTLDALQDRRLLVIVDAAEPTEQLPAGHWSRLDFSASPDALAGCPLRDTHTAGVGSMLRLARALGRLPAEVWIYAIAGERFAPETPLSVPARAAALQVVARIDSDIRAWAATNHVHAPLEPSRPASIKS